jgi:hypothetical protein
MYALTGRKPTGTATNAGPAIRVTAAHRAMLTTIDDHEVFDRVLVTYGPERPIVIADGETHDVSALVWDLEHLGWAWRPVDSLVWQLTDEGRRVRELPLRPPVPVIPGRSS